MEHLRDSRQRLFGNIWPFLKDIARNIDGLVKVGNEQWRARAEEDIKEGDEIVVTGVSGVTLIVEETEGGK